MFNHQDGKHTEARAGAGEQEPWQKNTKVQYNLQEAQSNAFIELGSHWPLLPYY